MKDILKINNNLCVFVDELGFQQVFDDLYRLDNNIQGCYICELIKINRSNGECVVFIPSLGFNVTAPIFYHKTVNLGDMLLIHLDDPNNGKIIGLHGKSVNYKDTDIEDNENIKFGNSQIILKNNEIILRIGNMDYVFNSNAFSIETENVLTNFQVNLPSLASVNFQDLDMVGASVDVRLGSLSSFNRKIPFLSSRPSAFSVNSPFGDIELSTIAGKVNISSMTKTNISAGASLNMISGATAGITAPFISNMTPGFGMPLIPSPSGLLEMPAILNNYLNPFRMPLPNSMSHIINKGRVFLP